MGVDTQTDRNDGAGLGASVDLRREGWRWVASVHASSAQGLLWDCLVITRAH